VRSPSSRPSTNSGLSYVAALKPILADQLKEFEDAAAEPYRPAVGQYPETAELRHRGRGRRGELPAMIVINISKKITDFRRRLRIRGRLVVQFKHLVPDAANSAAQSWLKDRIAVSIE
jgi:hypothetical protein